MVLASTLPHTAHAVQKKDIEKNIKILILENTLMKSNLERFRLLYRTVKNINTGYPLCGVEHKKDDLLGWAYMREFGIFYENGLIDKDYSLLDTTGLVNKKEVVQTNVPGRITLEENFILPRAITVKNTSAFTVTGLKFAMNGKDWSSTGAIISTIMKDHFSEKEKALAIWYFLQSNFDHGSSSHKLGFSHDPARFCNLTGYGICDDFAVNFAILAKAAGLKARIWELTGHTVPEVFFDNGWHILGPDKKLLFLMPDNATIAGMDHISSNAASCIRRNMDPGAYPEPDIAELIGFYSSKEDNQVTSWYEKNMSDTHVINFTLKPHEKLTFLYKARGPWYTTEDWSEPDSHTIIVDSVDLMEYDDLALYRPDKVKMAEDASGQNKMIRAEKGGCIYFTSEMPYPLVDGTISLGSTSREDISNKIKIYYSLRDDSYFELTGPSAKDNALTFNVRRAFNNFNANPSYRILFKIEFKEKTELTAFKIDLMCQVFPGSLPELTAGTNTVTVSAARKAGVEIGLFYKLSCGKNSLDLKGPVFPGNSSAVRKKDLTALSCRKISSDEIKEDLIKYEFILSNDPKCLFPLCNNFMRTLPSNAFPLSAALQDLLNPGQVYFWKVRARLETGETGPWSDIYSFKIN